MPPRASLLCKFPVPVLKLSPTSLEQAASFLGLLLLLHVGKLPRGL